MNNHNFSQGEIIYNNFNIDFDVPFEQQKDELLEDLLQIKFENDYLIDLGWYPECDITGKFILYLIKNENWQNPVYKHSCNKKDELIMSLDIAIGIINKQK